MTLDMEFLYGEYKNRKRPPKLRDETNDLFSEILDSNIDHRNMNPVLLASFLSLQTDSWMEVR
jgi:hypothetical protein